MHFASAAADLSSVYYLFDCFLLILDPVIVFHIQGQIHMSVRLPQKAFHAFCGAAAFANVWSKLRLWLIARAFSVAQEAHSLNMDRHRELIHGTDFFQ